jgi:hypothetical protein
MSAWIDSNRDSKRRRRGRKAAYKPASSAAPQSVGPTRRSRNRKARAEAAPSTPVKANSIAGTPLRIPYGNKDVAMKLGARYGSAGWPPPVQLDSGPSALLNCSPRHRLATLSLSLGRRNRTSASGGGLLEDGTPLVRVAWANTSGPSFSSRCSLNRRPLELGSYVWQRGSGSASRCQLSSSPDIRLCRCLAMRLLRTQEGSPRTVPSASPPLPSSPACSDMRVDLAALTSSSSLTMSSLVISDVCASTSISPDIRPGRCLAMLPLQTHLGSPPGPPSSGVPSPSAPACLAALTSSSSLTMSSLVISDVCASTSISFGKRLATVFTIISGCSSATRSRISVPRRFHRS